ncbi:MAG: hypothetical protein ABI970_12755 [Chloroflexota bacterium]
MANFETIVAVYDHFESANKAVQDLVNDGFSRDDIGLAVNNGGQKGEYNNLEANVDKYEDVTGPEGSAFGAVVGGLAGAAVVLTAIVIPGVGPIIAAGPLVALLGGATGAVVGGTAGAISGGVAASFIHLGISDDEADHYAEAIRRGNAVVTVTSKDENQSSLISDILRRYQPVNLKRRADEWRQKGWQASDAQPRLTNEDLKTEAEAPVVGIDQPYYGEDEAVRHFPYNPPNMPRS